MDMKLIAQDWEALAGKRMQFTHGFYERLFEAHPEYRRLFPEAMDTQMEKMVEMFSSIARFSGHVDLVRPYLHDVGFAHRKVGIHADDVEHFRQAFLETLAHHCAPWWNEDHARAWNEAFDGLILPMFGEGLETGRAREGGGSG